jgi:hypothetical protein
MSWFMHDVEANGPCPGLYSMTEFGVVMVTGADNPHRFHGKFTELDAKLVDPEAVKFMELEARPRVTPIGPDDIIIEDKCSNVMNRFALWVEYINRLKGKGRPMFISDNNGFDFQFINYYLWKYAGRNPFGHSSTNLGSLYKGMTQDMYLSFKHLRGTKHTHHPVDDSMGNVEAMMVMAGWGQIQGLHPEHKIRGLAPDSAFNNNNVRSH